MCRFFYDEKGREFEVDEGTKTPLWTGKIVTGKTPWTQLKGDEAPKGRILMKLEGYKILSDRSLPCKPGVIIDLFAEQEAQARIELRQKQQEAKEAKEAKKEREKKKREAKQQELQKEKEEPTNPMLQVGFVVGTASVELISYAAGQCSIHTTNHAHPIKESDESRRLVTEVVDAIDRVDEKKTGFMGGVLLAGNRRIFATSGKQENANLLTQTKLDWKYDTASDVILTFGQAALSVSVGSTALPQPVLNAMTPTGAGQRPAIKCAAPKLLEYARRRGLLNQTVFMSEMWYGSQIESPSWRHRKPAPSCAGCEILLPALLCGYNH
jgi:hypothetical protein